MSDALDLSRLSFSAFAERCEQEAVALEDRLTRYISSPQEHDLALPTCWPFIRFQLAKAEVLRLLREEK